MEFSRPEYWSGWPFPSAGDLPNPGIEPRSPALQADSLPTEPQGKPKNTGVGNLYLLQWIFPAQCLLHFRRILYQLSYQGNPKQVELPELVVTDHGVCFTCNLFERQVEENLGIPKAIFLILQTEKLRSREVK